MARQKSPGLTGGRQGRVAVFGQSQKEQRDRRNVATPTYVNSGRKGAGTRGGTGGKKAR